MVSTEKPVALVTGASSGIGAAFAWALARRGHDLALVALDWSETRDVAEAISAGTGVQCRALGLDLASPSGPGDVRQWIDDEGVRVDILINNAGVGAYGELVSVDTDRTLQQIHLNIRATFALTRAFLPCMVSRRHGTVINVGSIGSMVPLPFFATYGGTKAFVLSLTEALAEEVAPAGVRVMAVCPGPTATAFDRTAGMDMTRVDPFRLQKPPEEVVARALRDLARGRVLSIPHWDTWLQIQLCRFLPRRLVAWTAGQMFASVHGRRGLEDKSGK